MAWNPISGTVPQYEADGVPASGYYLKFYESGTTTPTVMAIDSSASATLSKCLLSTEGYPLNGSSDVFIPHIDQTYKIVLYVNATDADADTIANAEWVVDELTATSAASYVHPNHSGDIVSVADGATTAQPAIITGKSTAVPASTDFLLISDTDDSTTLKKVLVSDIITSGYTHPNHTGDVTSVGDGATTITTAAITDKTLTTIEGADSLLFYDTSTNTLREGLVSDIVTLAGGGGKQTIWIPCGAMRPTVSNGCAALTDIETTAGSPDETVLAFDKDTDEHAQFQVDFPKAWDVGNLQFRAHWTHAGAVSTGVAIGLQAVAVGDGDSIDTAFSNGTPVVVTDDAQGTGDVLNITDESGDLSVGGTPTDDTLIYFRVFRDVSNVSDDLAEDMYLIGMQLYYTTDAVNDA